MNVIMVCESALVSGGAEKVAIQEALELARRGHKVGYIAANDEADSDLLAAGVEVLLLNTSSFFEETNRSAKIQKIRWNAGIEPELKAFFARYSPTETVIHLHTFRLKLTGIVAHMAQDLGFPTLVHCHDYSPVCPTSLLYDHRLQKNCERKPMSLSCITCECQNQSWKYKLPKLTSFYWNQSAWKINRRAKGLIHISQLEEKTTTARISQSLKAFHAKPIGDPSPDARVSAEANQAFLFIGRLTAEKGIQIFLQHASEAKVPAVVVGDGPLAESLRQKYPDVRFTGWLNKEQITEELKAARALVVPSVWRETLCLSVIDAMQLGVPCIVSENVGAKEYIQDGKSGLIFEDGQLAQAILRMNDDQFVAGLSEKAFEVFQKNPPTVTAHIDELLEVYQACLEPQKA